jgi:hypothetical protein
MRLAVLLLLISPSLALASGTLKGLIIDASTNEALAGAHVLLVGTAIGGATDINGQYMVRNVPAGTYTVRCSYVGYDPKEVQVTIVDDAIVTQNFGLKAIMVEGQEVVITGQAVDQPAAELDQDRERDLRTEDQGTA